MLLHGEHDQVEHILEALVEGHVVGLDDVYQVGGGAIRTVQELMDVLEEILGDRILGATQTGTIHAIDAELLGVDIDDGRTCLLRGLVGLDHYGVPLHHRQLLVVLKLVLDLLILGTLVHGRRLLIQEVGDLVLGLLLLLRLGFFAIFEVHLLGLHSSRRRLDGLQSTLAWLGATRSRDAGFGP